MGYVKLEELVAGGIYKDEEWAEDHVVGETVEVPMMPSPAARVSSAQAGSLGPAQAPGGAPSAGPSLEPVLPLEPVQVAEELRGLHAGLLAVVEAALVLFDDHYIVAAAGR